MFEITDISSNIILKFRNALAVEFTSSSLIIFVALDINIFRLQRTCF